MHSLLLVAFLSIAQPQPYACGPYLLLPAEDAMTIVIDHNVPITAELVYGIDKQDGEERVVHDAKQRHHVFKLTDLQPGTRYWYQVRTNDQLAAKKRTFRTLPEKPDSYEVVVLGDVRSLPQRWHAVSQRIHEHEENALFVIGTGDYPVDGTKYALWRKQFFEPARNLLATKPMWPAIGNHEATRRHDDLTRPEASQYFSLFELPGNERWYRVDYHLMTLLVLDSNSRLSPEHEQYKWLRRQLRSERKRFTLVAFHHAPFSSGPHGKMHPDATPQEWPIDQGKRFLVPLFEMYGVDLVLNGHDHIYERSEKNGIPYVVTGGGGAPLYKINSTPNPYQVVAKSTNHYVRLHVAETGIDLSAIDPAGNIFDWASFAPARDNLARRTHHVTERVKKSITTGKPQLADRKLSCTVTNPLDHPMRAQLSMQEGEWTSEPASIELAAGVTKTVELQLAPATALAPTPWQSFRFGRLNGTITSRAEALPIRFSFARRLELDVPRYDVRQLTDAKVDGLATEWQDIPAIQIGKAQPVPRGVKNYAGAADVAATVRLAASDSRLHVFVDVRDPDVVDDGKASYFESDSFNLVLQRPRWQKPTAVPTILAFGAAGRATPDCEHRITQRAGGYTIEASMPLAQLPFASRSGGPLEAQFEVVLVDQDPGQGPSLHRLWTEHLRANVADYGNLRLVPK